MSNLNARLSSTITGVQCVLNSLFDLNNCLNEYSGVLMSVNMGLRIVRFMTITF